MTQAKKPKATKADPVVEALKDLTTAVNSIGDRVTAIEEKQPPANATEQIATHLKEEKEPEPEVQEAQKLHPKYRQIIDDVLGKQFHAWETWEETDSQHFMINIQVPPGLTTMTEKDFQASNELDIRSKAISRAEGENGVMEWAKQVRTNLSRFYSQNGMPSPFAAPIE